jgi:catechol 2,3-dioxygenase-like lactoylglutathione lyase family enzyme
MEDSMSASFFGFDHIDARVPSLKAVEPFYDRLMPELGLTRKLYAYVDADGEWHAASDERPYNTVEYYDDCPIGTISHFIGFVEDQNMQPTFTRVAFRMAAPLDAPHWSAFLESIGAKKIESSPDANYPAVFFEDPNGTKLEICARKPRVAEPS